MAPPAAGLRSACCLRRTVVAVAGSQSWPLPLSRFQAAGLCCLLAAAFAPAATEAAAAQQGPDEAVTITSGGALRGATRSVLLSVIDTYLGIPYAAPPVGALRLSRPQAPHGWSGVRNATQFGPVCPQVSGGRLVGEEDCLYLNVYAPHSNGSVGDGGGGGGSARAIMVFFHGGSFLSGSAAEFDPTMLALSGDVVVVTANYRLGLLGFLRVGDLNACSGDGGRRLAEANFGLWDQRAAVEWVQRNAAAFGGDAHRITVFGESAGARSVSLLALSPAANGLFQRVIAQSGSGSAARSLYRNTARTTASAMARLNVTVANGGGSGSKSCVAEGAAEQATALTALRSLDLGALVLVGSNPSPDWSPVIDGEFLPDDVERLWLLDGFRRLQYLCGYNSQEGLLFLGSAMTRAVGDFGWGSLDGGVNQTVLDSLIKSQLAELVPDIDGGVKAEALRRAAAEVYYGTAASNGSGNGQIDDRERLFIATDFIGDNYYAAPVTDLAHQRSAEGREANATYVYYLDRKRLVNAAGSGVPKWLRTGALHTDDLPLVFGGADLYALNTGENVTSTIELTFPYAFWIGDDTEAELAMKVMTYWTNFAKTGNPNTPEAVEVMWPVYAAKEPQLMLFHHNGSRVLTSLPNKRRLDFWHTMVFSEFRSLRSTTASEASTTQALEGIGWRAQPTPSVVAMFALPLIVTML